MNLVQFFEHFERVLNDKWYNELKSEFDLRQKLPKLKMKTPMLKQAGEIYTAAMLDKFQYEYEKFQATFVEEKKETDDSLLEYVVAIYGQIGVGKVLYNDEEMTVSCSCKKFKMEGILCSHALKVLDLMNIKLIPDRYILKRWTKHARDGNVQDFDGHDVEGISIPDYRAWTHDESQVISHPNFSEMLMDAMSPNSYSGFEVPSQFLDKNIFNKEQDDLLSQVGILGDVSNAFNMKSH
ncbi:Zinc finger, PMZ-type [Corchorus olitorius]|uniref:Protein FAR1-RELATED SEQUENCE n=1 Tax=Corchorus olitorius TaxID=93759 RepID=A0A1R3KP96_9ROSI|nr:Zinc finger, PMZ-type [Corchorus olitorius]